MSREIPKRFENQTGTRPPEWVNSKQTVYKWKKRSVFADRSHTAHHLQTVLTPAQETVVVHLRRTLLLPLDDLLAVTREFICPHVSRSGLDRCLRRHGAGNLNALKPQQPALAYKAFKSYEPGYVHMDVKYLPQMQDESSRRYLFVVIDRATRWVFVQFKANKTAASAQAFLKALHKACPIRINKLLTDNGKEFTDRLFARKEREPSGNHEFDQLCQELGIEHRLTKPRTPRTNGMVERFNGRIADVLKTHRFNSREDMEQTLLRYVALYNHQLPQSALKSSTPMQAMKEWYQTHPHLFHKRPYDRTGCDKYPIIYLFFCALGCMFQRFYQKYPESLELASGSHPHPAVRDDYSQLFLVRSMVDYLVAVGGAPDSQSAGVFLVYAHIRAAVITGLFISHRVEASREDDVLPSFMSLQSPQHMESMKKYKSELLESILMQAEKVITGLHMNSVMALE